MRGVGKKIHQSQNHEKRKWEESYLGVCVARDGEKMGLKKAKEN